MILFPSFISRAVLYTGPCVPFTPGLIGPRLFFVCFALSFIVLAVSCIFDCYHILYHFSLLLLYEPYPKKLLKKIKGISVPILSRALLGQLNSLKAGEVIALQITRSLSDNKVSVFTNKSALH